MMYFYAIILCVVVLFLIDLIIVVVKSRQKKIKGIVIHEVCKNHGYYEIKRSEEDMNKHTMIYDNEKKVMLITEAYPKGYQQRVMIELNEAEMIELIARYRDGQTMDRMATYLDKCCHNCEYYKKGDLFVSVKCTKHDYDVYLNTICDDYKQRKLTREEEAKAKNNFRMVD